MSLNDCTAAAPASDPPDEGASITVLSKRARRFGRQCPATRWAPAPPVGDAIDRYVAVNCAAHGQP